MGCFLGCFGFSCKRKRRKPANRVGVIHGDQIVGSYEPLGSVSPILDIAEEPISSDSQLSRKDKEPLNYKIRKKVSFNLNVKTYEPIPKEETANYYWESDEEDKKEETNKETEKQVRERDPVEMKMTSYPSNYRYKNCIDSYDEEDEIAYEESDLDDDDYDEEEKEEDDDDDDDEDEDYEDLETRPDLCDKFNSLSVNSQSRDSSTLMADDRTKISNPLGDSSDGNARHRGRYAHSVLNPVENLSQWKAVKASGKPQGKRQRKENLPSEQQPEKPFISKPNSSQSRPLIQDIAVDVSLTNWLTSPDSCRLRVASIAVETLPSKKSSFEGTHAWRDRDDMPILDITNLGPDKTVCSSFQH